MVNADGKEYGREKGKWPIVAIFLAALLLVAVFLLWQWRGPDLWGSFGRRPQRILYLGWDGEDHTQIFVTDLAGGAPVQLTQEATDVLDFALSPEGDSIAYATEVDDSSTALWLVDSNGRNRQQVLACLQALCSEIVWAADGRRLIYERRDLTAGDEVPGPPRLWWLDVESGESVTVAQNADAITFGASISPDGKWLSYVSPVDEAVQVYNFQDGRHFLIPSQVNTPAVWSPQGSAVLVGDLGLVVTHGSEDDDHLEHGHAYDESIHLFLTEINSQERIALSQAANVDDGTPAWSPSGEWIAFGRKIIHTQTGRQLWLVRADGSDERALTDDLMVHHGSPVWSPDGHTLLFQRLPLSEPNARPAIWAMELATGNVREIVRTGIFPVWLP